MPRDSLPGGELQMPVHKRYTAGPPFPVQLSCLIGMVSASSVSSKFKGLCGVLLFSDLLQIRTA